MTSRERSKEKASRVSERGGEPLARRPINLSGAFLRRTDLSNANLERANLSGADFSHANMRGANFRDAILEGTILRGADQRNAKPDSFATERGDSGRRNHAARGILAQPDSNE